MNPDRDLMDVDWDRAALLFLESFGGRSGEEILAIVCELAQRCEDAGRWREAKAMMFTAQVIRARIAV